MNAHIALAIAALEQMRGDDLPRARAAFRSLPPAKMAERYGQSDQTCAEILRGYEEHDARVTAAISHLRSLP